MASKAQQAFEKYYKKEECAFGEKCTFYGEGELEGWSAGDVGELMDIFEQKAPDIKTIDMVDNWLGDEGAAAVGGKLRKLSELDALFLGGNQIGDAGATAVARGLAGCDKLERLWLHNNQIGDAGATAVARELAGCDKLKGLGLHGNQIGDAGATAVARGLAGCDKLELLNLDVDPERVDWPAMGWSIPHELQQGLKVGSSFNWAGIARFMGKNKAQHSGQAQQAPAAAASPAVPLPAPHSQPGPPTSPPAQAQHKKKKARTAAASPAVPLPAPHPQPGPPTSHPAQRKQNRWADGLEAPAAGERPFFPGGWTPSKNVWEAVEVFGQTEEEVRALAADARPKVAKLKLVQISVSDKLVAAVLAYTKEAPNLYADLNKACRSPGGRWEQLLTHYRDYLYHLNRAIQALPNFSGDVYRGIDDCSLGDAYVEGKTITWQQFSSASKKPNVALRFLRADGSRLVGSLFILQVDTGKELEMCSEFPDEEEVLLPLNSHFKVRRVIKDKASKLETLPMLKHYKVSGLVLYLLEQL